MRTLVLLVLAFGTATGAKAQVNLNKIAPRPPAAAAIESASWQACADARTVGPCEAYLRDYRGGSYARVAQSRIDDIRRGQAEVAQKRAATPVAPGPIEGEPQLWAACQAGATVALCERYLSSYPLGPSAEMARSRITALYAAAAEKSAFAQCQASSTPELCKTFIATYPASSLVAAAKAQSAVIATQSAQRAAAEKQQAKQRIAAEKAQAEQRKAAEKALSAQRKAATRAGGASDADKAAFAACRDGNNPATCKSYLDAAPKGAFRSAAQARIKALEIENTAFDACSAGPSAAPCLAFGRAFPDSAKAGRAAAIARDRNITAAAAAQAEAAAWERCEPSQAALACQRYLASYPSGPHAAAAQVIIDRISEDAQRKGLRR